MRMRMYAECLLCQITCVLTQNTAKAAAAGLQPVVTRLHALLLKNSALLLSACME